MLNFLAVLNALVSRRLERDDKGATAVEYGLMVALIAAAIVLMVTALGVELGALFTGITGEIDIY